MTSADLSENDVDELGAFLLGTCDDVSRWLPPPLWMPAWWSEAEQECRNTEQGQLGPWGQDPHGDRRILTTGRYRRQCWTDQGFPRWRAGAARELEAMRLRLLVPTLA